MAKQFTVLLDLDSTIFDLLTPWTAWYNEKYDDTLTPQDVDTWNWHEKIKPECGSKVYEYLYVPKVFNSLQPFSGALEAIKLVDSWGSVKQVFCSTITGITASAEKVETVERYFPYIGRRNLVLCGGDKTLIQGDVLVDDGPHNLEAFRADGRLTVVADMHGAPYCAFPPADAIMTDWSQYPSIIEKLWRENFG